MNKYITATLLALIATTTGQAQAIQLMQELTVCGTIDQLRCGNIEKIVFNFHAQNKEKKDTRRQFFLRQEKVATYGCFDEYPSINLSVTDDYQSRFEDNSIHIRAPNT